MEHSERLQYEPLGHEHVDGLLSALDDERVGRYIGGPDVTTAAALHDRVDFLAAGHSPSDPDEHWVNLVVRRRDGGVVIGRVEATVVGRRAELAYVFGPASWGHGYATEAMWWLIGHLQTRFDIDELYAAIHPDNHRSRRLVERLGLFEVMPPVPALLSYDDGDVVYQRGLSETG